MLHNRIINVSTIPKLEVRSIEEGDRRRDEVYKRPKGRKLIKTQNVIRIYPRYERFLIVNKREKIRLRYIKDNRQKGQKNENFSKRFVLEQNKNNILPNVGVLGINKVLDSKSLIWLRLFWLIIVLGCLTLTFYQIYDRLQFFFKSPVIESIRIVQENKIQLPNITICPSELSLQEFLRFEVGIKNIKIAVEDFKTRFKEDILPEFRKSNVSEDVIERWYLFQLKYLNGLQIKLEKSLERKINNSLSLLHESDISISWECIDIGNGHLDEHIKSNSVKDTLSRNKNISETGSSMNTCTLKKSPEAIRTIWGNCYSYKFDKSHHLHLRGKEPGFTIKVERPAERVTPTDTNYMYDELYYNLDGTLQHIQRGFKIIIFSGEMSKYQAFRQHLEIENFRKVIFYLRRKEFQRLNNSNNKCMDSESYAKCIDECMYENMPKICRLPFLDWNAPLCKSISEGYLEVYKVYIALEASKCFKCSRLCFQTLYWLSTKKDALPLYGRNDIYSELHLKFNDNTYELISESYSYSFSQLLSDIGGTLGLFLGCSVLSIIELLESLINY